MSYTTYYLRFASKEEAETKLTEVNYLHEDTFNEESITYYAVKDQVGDVDVVGEIWNNDGEYDLETGEVITPPTKKRWLACKCYSSGRSSRSTSRICCKSTKSS